MFDKEARARAEQYTQTKVIYSKAVFLVRTYTNFCHKLKLPVDLSSLPLPFDIKRRFQKEKYDAVYISGYIRGALTIANLNSNRCPVYYHHHVCTDLLNDRSIRGRDLFEQCKKVGFVSNYCCNVAQTRNRKYDKKIALFSNCIDTNKFILKGKPEIRQVIREKYKINEEDIVFVFVGRFVENKGVYQLIKAFSQIIEEVDSAKLLLVGGETYSSNTKTKYVKKCRDLIQTMADKIILTGYISNNSLPSIFAAADVACIPSVYEEACGLTALEAMASGLPVITTDAGGIKEYVPGECKFVSEWKKGMNPDEIIPELKSAMIELSRDRSLRIKMGQAAQKEVSKYDIQNYLEKFASFLA